MRATSFLVMAISLSIALMMSCTLRETEWTGTIEEKDGIIIIKNPNEPFYENSKIGFEEEIAIGESGQKEESLFNVIISVAVDDRERIFVGDFNEAHIKIFNDKGAYLKTVGRKGQGPGEFESVCKIQITPKKEDEFFYDIFDQEGKYIYRVLLKGRPRVWKNDKLYSVEEDQEGFQIVKRYQMNWLFH
jgi:hypothetical protein